MQGMSRRQLERRDALTSYVTKLPLKGAIVLCGGRVCCVTMSSKGKSIMSNSTNLVSLIVSMIALMLGFVAFLRIEIQLNSQETKIAAVEQSCMKRIDELSLKFTGKNVLYMLCTFPFFAKC